MLSSTLATTTWAMRPNLFFGLYPERRDRDSHWIDRMFNALTGNLARLGIDRQVHLQNIAKAIDRQGTALTRLDTAQLDSLRMALRGEFRRQGLRDSLCIQAFALIREMAARTIQFRHFDSQLMGGWVMLHGQLAEMETGEGKTLAVALAAATAALAGIPVHVITVNDYLVERDAGMMGPLYRSLGLTSGFVTQRMASADRRFAYGCDITYCTNKRVAFDYLSDRLLLGNRNSQLRLQLEAAFSHGNRFDRLLLRGLCFAIVDEADSALIDEARTPLILTRDIDTKQEQAVYRQALLLAQAMVQTRDFFIDQGQRTIHLGLAGQQKLAELRLPSKGVWQNSRVREEMVCRALHALHLLHRDHDYLVREEKVCIIDPNTGRIMPDRSWERGLHQMVEAKEGCPLTAPREQVGRMTYQRFFRRYVRLSGTTGTAREVASELWSVYGLRVRRIPLNRPSLRRALPVQVLQSAEDKWAAVIDAVRQMQNQERPVLIGTASVADSEALSLQLTEAGIAHRVLNARQDKEEAEIVAMAGRKIQVTVATNMAGRGTDIPLAEGVAALGGLHVIATSRNDAERIDRQLFGRCARQGDPGTHQSILSLEDPLVKGNCRPLLLGFFRSQTRAGHRFQRALNLHLMRRAQRSVERRHLEARRALLKHERHTGRLLAFSGPME